MVKRILFLFYLLLLLSHTALAYEIQGDSVVYENANAKLKVTPHTATSPLGKDYKQFFEFTNKTGSSQSIYVAFVFSYKLDSASIYTSSGQDVSSAFSYYVNNGKHYYYITSPVTFSAGETKEYLLKYTPDDIDDVKKWDFYAWKGASWDCIISDTCDVVYEIDPWFNNSFVFRRELTITANADLNAGFPIDLNIDDFSLTQCGIDGKCQPDFDDVRITLGEDTEVPRSVETTSGGDANRLWFELSTAIDNGNTDTYYIYYGNTSAAAPTDTTGIPFPGLDFNYGTDNNRTMAFYRMDETAGTIAYDSADYNVTGDIMGATLSSGSACLFNGCLEFDGGAGDSIDFGVADANRINTEDWSVELWLLGDAVASGADVIIDNYNDSKTGYMLRMEGGTRNLQFANPVDMGYVADLNITLSTTNWKYVVMTYDDITKFVRAYDNGIEVYASDSSGTGDLNRNDVTDLCIGVDCGNSALAFDGLIDGVRFSSYTKTSPEIYSTYNNSVNFLTLTSMTVGSEETAPPSLDANFSYSPNPITNLDPEEGITSVTVTFTDTSDYNGGTMSGTGWRWDINSVTFSTDANTTYDFTTVGDFNVCFDVNASGGGFDLNDSQCYILSVYQNPQGVSFVSGLKNYNTDANVVVDFNSFSTTTGAKTYSWTIDGSQISTDENMTYDFNIAGDFNACVIITAAGQGAQSCASQFITKTLVKIPKDEDTQLAITPFEYYVYSNPDQNFNALSGDKNFFLFSLDLNDVKVKVDTNADYYSRFYYITSDGNYYVLQPYLISTVAGVSTQVIAQNKVDLSTIPDVTIEIYRSIPGITGLVLVEKVITDGKGEALISGLTNEQYTFKVYYAGTKISDVQITVTSTTIYISFDPSGITTQTLPKFVQVGFSPASGLLKSTDTTLTQYITVETTTITEIDINMVQNNGVSIYFRNLTDANSIANGYTNIITLSTDLTTWDLNRCADLNVTVLLADGNRGFFVSQYCQYDVNKPGHWVSNQLRTGIKQEFGCKDGEPCPATALISIFLTLVLCAGLAVKSEFRDPIALFAVGAFPLGFFTWFEWLPGTWFIIYIIFATVSLMAKWRTT